MPENLEPGEAVAPPDAPSRDEVSRNLADLDRYAAAAREAQGEAGDAPHEGDLGAGDAPDEAEGPQPLDRGIGPGDAAEETEGIREVASPEAWQEAWPAERLQLARQMHGRFRENYGLPPQELGVDPNMREQVSGQWHPERGVSINERLLTQDTFGQRSSYEATVRTLAHENRHALQGEVREEGRDIGPDTEALRESWRKAAADYKVVPPPWNYARYRANALEEDAFACADRVWAEMKRQEEMS